jgi:hypothetical protein
MVKITIIGAGVVFCKTLIADILNSVVKDVEFCLMDLNAQKLEWSKQYAEKVIAQTICLPGLCQPTPRSVTTPITSLILSISAA